jgi:hypothetical protein
MIALPGFSFSPVAEPTRNNIDRCRKKEDKVENNQKEIGILWMGGSNAEVEQEPEPDDDACFPLARHAGPLPTSLRQILSFCDPRIVVAAICAGM